MKRLLYNCVIILLLLSGCTFGPSTLTIETRSFPKNSVLSVYSPSTGATYLTENIINSKQNLKINLKKKGYAVLRAEIIGGARQEYWFYLNGDDYDAVFDFNEKKYPFINIKSEENKEFKNYYEIYYNLSGSIMDSLANAQVELDKSTRENVEEKARALDYWMEKRNTKQLNVIETFAKKHPNSKHTLFLLDQLGEVDTNTGTYVSIFNGLSNEVKESKAGKNFLEQVTRKSRMMAGRIMPDIEGESPSGNAFEKKILKKVNLVIVWTSYNTKTRKNTKFLTELYNDLKTKDVEFIGVSLDKNRNWWVNVIRDDKLIWPQFSDLKGAQSPNAKNLSDYNVPYFFIIDKDARILMNNDLQPDFIRAEIEKRL